MFLFVFSGDGVLVTEDEVDFICCAALVGTEHDCVGSLVGEFLGLDALGRLSEEFEVSASAFETILEFGFVSI